MSTVESKNTNLAEEPAMGRVEIDAVHPRFQSREDLLFFCPNCRTKKPTEEQMKRHFLKKSCFPVHSICTECAGPVFYYKFGPTDTRLWHDCEKWAKYNKKKKGCANGTESDANSIAESFATNSTDNEQTDDQQP